MNRKALAAGTVNRKALAAGTVSRKALAAGMCVGDWGRAQRWVAGVERSEAPGRSVRRTSLSVEQWSVISTDKNVRRTASTPAARPLHTLLVHAPGS